MNFDKLKGNVPDSIFSQLPITCVAFEINTELRLCHFLAQCSHESANFTSIRENLNYSANGLLSVFGRYFDEKSAVIFARQPEKIANIVYANRLGNGDVSSGDGWNYRGRGFIQLTGKNNYVTFSNYMNDALIKSNPDLVATKYPLSSAAFFFWKNDIFAVCDNGFGLDVITAVTKRVNGGVNGLQDRVDKFNTFYKLFS
jgi:putative chitinase